MSEYPKIHSLWKRHAWYFSEEDKKNCPPEKRAKRQSFIVGDYAVPEFGNIVNWSVEEKIDGTNIRIFWQYSEDIGKHVVRFGGRTSAAQIPCHLLDYLQSHFTSDRLRGVFGDDPAKSVILYGEGYGPKIQAAGPFYSDSVGFCLFDIKVGHWWLTRAAIHELGSQLDVDTPPCFGTKGIDEIVEFVKSRAISYFSLKPQVMEGVVCRPEPLMLYRDGDPIMMKLKCKEF